MMGTKPSLATCATFWESVTPSYRRTATYIALAHLLREGGADGSRLKFDQRVQCEGVQGLAQLPRISILGTSVNRLSSQLLLFGAQRRAGLLTGPSLA